MSTLHVRYGTRVVGRLRSDDAGRFAFAYHAAWLADPTAFPVSLSLPIREHEYAGGAGHAFFANLLPEGLVRQAVCDRLGLSVDNDFGLLRAIGGECAGALSVVDPEEPVDEEPPDHYELLDDRRLRSLVERDGVPLLIGGPRTRLSLAGAQDKLPVAIVNDRIHLPVDGSPSTHILKLPSPRFPHLTSNEDFVLGLATRAGLAAVTCELVERTAPPSLLVERYDRRRSNPSEPVQRLHQEDLCQALGLPSTRKYEQEGGPTLARVIQLVRDHVRQPAIDVRRLIEWQAFNIVVGNADGHGKNLAIVYDDRGPPRLSPFYDLVSTREYERIDRQLAMGVGGLRDPDRIARAEWALLGREIGVTDRVIRDIVDELATRCLDALDGWTSEYRKRHRSAAVLQTLPRRIRRRAQRLQRALVRS